jgi:hypothetical protein
VTGRTRFIRLRKKVPHAKGDEENDQEDTQKNYDTSHGLLFSGWHWIKLSSRFLKAIMVHRAHRLLSGLSRILSLRSYDLKKAGWSLGYVSAIDSEGRTIWIADAHRGDGKRFVVHAQEKLTAFLELESVIHGRGGLV